MSTRLAHFLPILDDHVPGRRVSTWRHKPLVNSLVADQHLHVLFDHEIVVIRRQRLGRWVVPAHCQSTQVLHWEFQQAIDST